jgi:hypothetical protein
MKQHRRWLPRTRRGGSLPGKAIDPGVTPAGPTYLLIRVRSAPAPACVIMQVAVWSHL